MKTPIKPILMIALAIFLFVSCETEDPGPLQEDVKDYAVLDFDQLEMGSGLNIRVEQGNTFAIKAEGDRRNLYDLEVYKTGSSLIVEFDEDGNRHHETYITIQMPKLRKVNFSGGSVSVVEGFESDEKLDVIISGGSVSQIDAGFRETNIIVSGGSVLKMHGLGDVLIGDVSGASAVDAFDFPVRAAEIRLTGASVSKLTVSDELTITATGASNLSYRGNPSVQSDVSGGSAVVKE